MAGLPKNYLSKSGRQWRKVSLLDLAILIHHVYRATQDEEIGHLDANESLESLVKKLEYKTLVDPSILESALFSANMNDEKGAFWHPLGLTFDDWTKRIIGSDVYNKTYGTIEKKEQ